MLVFTVWPGRSSGDPSIFWQFSYEKYTRKLRNMWERWENRSKPPGIVFLFFTSLNRWMVGRILTAWRGIFLHFAFLLIWEIFVTEKGWFTVSWKTLGILRDVTLWPIWARKSLGYGSDHGRKNCDILENSFGLFSRSIRIFLSMRKMRKMSKKV